ncbi:long-chain fatty acid transport protein 4-like [Tropilaelaps mercedesae]|uniref:Long-chain-fatty-acid--CoA ligase n=1 Tax=Tropilaelaps mercedesae TaxID=418985 RepID=A0A1V9X1E4_9ACAR|nr:long-chain fatty acid transport protein 4-like [Tropilaelaps mercedesae]
MMHNCPEMVFLWLGLAKIASGLINIHFRKTPLEHSMSTINAKAVIFSPVMMLPLLKIVEELRQQRNDISFFCLGDDDLVSKFPVQNIEKALSAFDITALTYRGSINDRLMYVFTPGTIGLPTPAIIKHSRLILAAAVSRYLAGVTTNDVLYIYLPLYHMAGGVLGISQSVAYDCRTEIVAKFSASGFWRDCIRYKCTVSQYIGEVWRYPRSGGSVRILFGNSLRPKMWPAFVKRFGINDIIARTFALC